MADVDLTGWCAKVAARYRQFEQIEMALYPSSDDRDRKLVEWVVRVLARPVDSDGGDALAVIAAQREAVTSGG